MCDSAELAELATELATTPDFTEHRKFGTVSIGGGIRKRPPTYVSVYWIDQLWWWVWTGRNGKQYAYSTDNPLAWQSATPERKLLVMRVELTTC